MGWCLIFKGIERKLMMFFIEEKAVGIFRNFSYHPWVILGVFTMWSRILCH